MSFWVGPPRPVVPRSRTSIASSDDSAKSLRSRPDGAVSRNTCSDIVRRVRADSLLNRSWYSGTPSGSLASQLFWAVSLTRRLAGGTLVPRSLFVPSPAMSPGPKLFGTQSRSIMGQFAINLSRTVSNSVPNGSGAETRSSVYFTCVMAPRRSLGRSHERSPGNFGVTCQAIALNTE